MRYKVILGIILIVIAYFVYSSVTSNPKTSPTESSNEIKSVSESDAPQIVSTKPNPLDNAIVSATEKIEITFNRPLENIGEFKNKIEPKVEYKVELSSDRKTAIITFPKSLELGSSYALSIGPDTKFDGAGEWRQSKDFHFRTVTYKGI